MKMFKRFAAALLAMAQATAIMPICRARFVLFWPKRMIPALSKQKMFRMCSRVKAKMPNTCSVFLTSR